MMLSWPMIAFGWVTNMLQRGMASWKRMLEVLDVEPAVKDQVRLRRTARLPTRRRRTWDPALAGLLKSRGDRVPRLTFAYNGTTVLDRMSARIAAGQTVALVGVTGSGKSTLISLLARLHEPPRGTVFLDGVDVRDIPLSVLRGAIGFVPQEPFLFSDTIADNIAFGLDAREGARRARRKGGTGGQACSAVGGTAKKRWAAAMTCARGASRMPPRRPARQGCRRLSQRLRNDRSASAASRCRAARSSAPRSPAPSPSIRAS